VGGDEVCRALEQVVRDGDQQETGVDVEDVAAGDPRWRPPDPGILDDRAAAKVSELAEVRVVDLEQIAEVLADVAVREQTGAAHVDVEAGILPVGSAVLVD